MMHCDQCGKDCSVEFLTAVNPEGGFGLPRSASKPKPWQLMCDECLDAAPEGSYAAKVRELVRLDVSRPGRL